MLPPIWSSLIWPAVTRMPSWAGQSNATRYLCGRRLHRREYLHRQCAQLREERGIKKPSFFGYMLWSCGIPLLFGFLMWLFLNRVDKRRFLNVSNWVRVATLRKARK